MHLQGWCNHAKSGKQGPDQFSSKPLNRTLIAGRGKSAHAPVGGVELRVAAQFGTALSAVTIVSPLGAYRISARDRRATTLPASSHLFIHCYLRLRDHPGLQRMRQHDMGPGLSNTS
jgi:hypothetical protein